MLAVLLGLLAAAPNPQSTPVVMLPPRSVTTSLCSASLARVPSTGETKIIWNIATTNTTGRDIRKIRLRVDLYDPAKEEISMLTDLDAKGVHPVPSVPYYGKWKKAPFPLGLSAVHCSVLGVRFMGDPNIYALPPK